MNYFKTINIIIFHRDELYRSIELLNNTDLLYTLIGGEIALLALFFSLIPIILEKTEAEYFLGENIKDFFLYENSNKGKLINIWKQSSIVLCLAIFTAFIKCNVLSYSICAILMVYIIYQIYIFLRFISHNNEIKNKIESHINDNIKSSPSEVIRNMISVSTKNYVHIHSDLDFLYGLNFKERYIEEYVDLFLKENSIYKENLLYELVELIKDNNCNLNLKLDTAYLYLYFRNSLSDYNKEAYYDAIYVILFNKYNCYLKEENKYKGEHYAKLMLDAIDNSQLSNENKLYLMKRLIKNTYYYHTTELNSSDKNYRNGFSYMFDLLKYIIDYNNIELFKQFIITFDELEKPLLLDVYTTAQIYFYYLIHIERECYISEEEKNTYIQMKAELDKIYQFDRFVYEDHYYINLDDYCRILRDTSHWWDRINMDEGARICVSPNMVENVIKGLIMIFKKEDAFSQYNFDLEIIEMFKSDFKNGQLIDSRKKEINTFFEYINYNENPDIINNFENEYLNYISKQYKNIELNSKINIDDLKEKLINEKSNIIADIKCLDLFNSSKSETYLKHVVTLNFDKRSIEGYYKNHSIIKIKIIQEVLEKYIYEKLLNNTSKTIEYSLGNYSDVLECLHNSNSKKYYFKPSYDILEKYRDVKDEYMSLISKYNIINFYSGIKERFLIEDYKCSFGSFDVSVSNISSDSIDEILDKYKVTNNTFCKQNDDLVEILYTEEEFIELVKNTYVDINLEFKIGLDIKGDDNVMFVRK